MVQSLFFFSDTHLLLEFLLFFSCDGLSLLFYAKVIFTLTKLSLLTRSLSSFTDDFLLEFSHPLLIKNFLLTLSLLLLKSLSFSGCSSLSLGFFMLQLCLSLNFGLSLTILF